MCSNTDIPLAPISRTLWVQRRIPSVRAKMRISSVENIHLKDIFNITIIFLLYKPQSGSKREVIYPTEKQHDNEAGPLMKGFTLVHNTSSQG